MHSLSLPRIPLGSTGYGTSRGGRNLHWISRRYGRKAHQKARLDLAYRRPQHLCDSTVASPLLSFGPWFSRQPDRSGGVETVLRHIASGACRGQTVPNPNPRNLKGSHDDYPNGGGGCLGHLPPSLITHAFCMLCTKQSEPRREGDNDRPDRPKRSQRKNPKTRKKAEGVGCESGT